MSRFDFDRMCQELGSAERLTALARRVRRRRASPELDAEIALEVGWLVPYSHLVRGGHLITGVTIVETRERFPLYGPWFTRSREDWWNSGRAISDNVQNILKFSSDPGAAMQTLPPLNELAPCTVVLKKNGLWTVDVFANGGDLIGRCEPGADTLAKALLLAGIDCRLRSLQKLRAEGRQPRSIEPIADWDTTRDPPVAMTSGPI